MVLLQLGDLIGTVHEDNITAADSVQNSKKRLKILLFQKVLFDICPLTIL